MCTVDRNQISPSDCDLKSVRSSKEYDKDVIHRSYAYLGKNETEEKVGDEKDDENKSEVEKILNGNESHYKEDDDIDSNSMSNDNNNNNGINYHNDDKNSNNNNDNDSKNDNDDIDNINNNDINIFNDDKDATESIINLKKNFSTEVGIKVESHPDFKIKSDSELFKIPSNFQKNLFISSTNEKIEKDFLREKSVTENFVRNDPKKIKFCALSLNQFIFSAFTASLNVIDSDLFIEKKKNITEYNNKTIFNESDGSDDNNTVDSSPPKKLYLTQHNENNKYSNSNDDKMKNKNSALKCHKEFDDSHTKSLKDVIVDDVLGGIERGFLELFVNNRTSNSSKSISMSVCLSVDDSDSDRENINNGGDDSNEDDKDDYERGKAINSNNENTTSVGDSHNMRLRTRMEIASDHGPDILTAHTQEPMLPCEFCSELIRLTLLQTHQVECGASRGQLRRNQGMTLFVPPPPPLISMALTADREGVIEREGEREEEGGRGRVRGRDGRLRSSDDEFEDDEEEGMLLFFYL